MSRWRNFLTSTLHRVQGSAVHLHAESAAAIPAKAYFEPDSRLLDRIREAHEKLPPNSVKSLRRQLEDAVTRGDRDEAKRLTAETFKAMGVQ